MQDSKKDRDIKNRVLDSVGEGKGGMIRENSIKPCILSGETDDQSKFHAWNRALKPVHWDNPEGWDGEGDGRGVRAGAGGWTHVHPWLIHVSVEQKPLQYCKVISLQLKINSLKRDIGTGRTGCQETGSSKAKERSLKKQTHGHLDLTSCLQNCEKANFCCLSHPVCGILSYQP